MIKYMMQYRPIKFSLFLFLFGISQPSYSNICDLGIDAFTSKEWIVSNMCHFQNTAVIEIDRGYLIGKYNPYTYFRHTGSYQYSIEVVDVIQGVAPKSIHCLQDSSEDIKFSTSDLTGKRIISFDEYSSECIFLDISIYPKANKELINYARSIATEIESQ